MFILIKERTANIGFVQVGLTNKIEHLHTIQLLYEIQLLCIESPPAQSRLTLAEMLIKII